MSISLRRNLVGLFCLLISTHLAAENLYHVTLLRAAPGEFPALIEHVKEIKNKRDMLIMRHSQGDHWDLMLLAPANRAMPNSQDFNLWVDFQHDFLARSKTDWKTVANQSKSTGLFHIEMFQAAKGKYDKLLEQRRMENKYYHATERAGNLIFETVFGSDVDIFTVGLYPDLKTFATDPDLPNAVFEKAATDAGFKSRSDIGFYLRKFLVGHQDTLATQIK